MSALRQSLVGSIDQGTSSSRFLVFDGDKQLICQKQIEFQSIYPKQGWAEQDPWVLVQTVKQVPKPFGIGNYV